MNVDELVQKIEELLGLIMKLDDQQNNTIRVYRRLIEIQKEQIVSLKQEIRDLKEELEQL